MRFNVIPIIVILLIVVPMYTDDIYAGTLAMIKSSKWKNDIVKIAAEH